MSAQESESAQKSGPAQKSEPKIIVLDDDPTGSQTVHSCLLLLKWDVPTLLLGLQADSPIFFVLTNTRSLTPQAAAAVTTEVCQNLKQALALSNIDNFLLVSRSDSTLRGHYPLETNVIAEQLGPFDAHFLTPAFFEGGRITVDSTHYIESAGRRIPTHETEFARDSVFAYSSSYLPSYVEEKTEGAITADEVVRLTLPEIRKGTFDQLMVLEHNRCVAVDGEGASDFNQFAADLLAASAQGKRFLFRSAAGLLSALAALPPQPTPATKMSQTVRGPLGAVIVGSHVKKTTQQLLQLLKQPTTVGIEVDVTQIKADNAQSVDTLLKDILARVHAAHAQSKTPVIYTSREELTFADKARRLAFGESVSALLMAVVQSLPQSLGFLISKGGITSNDILSKGLSLTSVKLLGQVVPGVSVVTTPSDHALFPNLPVVLFPGNVGDENALALAYQRLCI